MSVSGRLRMGGCYTGRSARGTAADANSVRRLTTARGNRSFAALILVPFHVVVYASTKEWSGQPSR